MKSIISILVILQMILYPVMPVLAEEIVVPIAEQTTVEQPAVEQAPTQGFTLTAENTEPIVQSISVGENQSNNSTLVNNEPALPATENSLIVESNTSETPAGSTINMVEPTAEVNATTTTIVGEALVVTTTEAMLPVKEEKKEVKNIIEKIVETVKEKAVEVIEKVEDQIEGNNSIILNQIISGASITDEQFFQKTGVATKIKDAEFKVKDEFTDEADISPTSKVLRFYRSPRQIMRGTDGALRLLDETNRLFSEANGLTVKKRSGTYLYRVKVDGRDYVKVSGGNLDFDDGTVIMPDKKFTVQETSGQTEIKDFYTGVDLKFRDSGNFRERFITLKENPFKNNTTANNIIFWENYEYTPGAELIDWQGNKLVDGQEIGLIPVYIKFADGLKFQIKAPVIFDSSSNEMNYQALMYQIKIDAEKNILSLGVKVSAGYLLKSDLVYPVTIDPVVTLCGKTGRTCNNYIDLYYRQMTNTGGTSTIQDDAVPVADSSTYLNRGLFSGYYLNGSQKTAREIAVYFNANTFQDKEWSGEVTDARLYMKYIGPGLGNAGSAVFEAKSLDGVVPDTTTFKYSQLVSSIMTYVGASQTINASLANTPYSFNITQMVKNWFQDQRSFGYGPVRAFIFEPSDRFWGDLVSDPMSWPNQLFVFGASESANSNDNPPYFEVTIGYSDLAVSPANISSSFVNPGDTISVDFIVGNQSAYFGTVKNSQSFIVIYYLKKKQLVNGNLECVTSSPSDATDNTLLTVQILHGYGTATTLSRNLTIPTGIPNGEYCIAAQVDPDDVVMETNELNNWSFRNITIGQAAGTVDLLVRGFAQQNNTTFYTTGNFMTVDARIANLGTGSANNVEYSLLLKRPSDGQLYNLNCSNTVSLPAHFDGTMSLTCHIPHFDNFDLQNNYQVKLILDQNNLIAETDENNNYSFGDTQVTVERYNIGGGGTATPPDSNNDGITDAVSISTGVTAIANTSKPIYDQQNRNSYQRTVADNTTKNSVGDPVNSRTGAFEFEQNDFKLAGRGFPLNLTRTYNSKLTDRNSRFGNGWSYSYHIYYYQDPTTKNVQVYLGGALISFFTTSDDGLTFQADPGNYNTLIKEGDYLVYRTVEGTRYKMSLKLVDNIGMLERIEDANSNATIFTYNTIREVQLIKEITDPAGRKLVFTYPGDTDPNWSQIKSVNFVADGVNEQTVTYDYDVDGNLTKVSQLYSYSGEADRQAEHKFTYDSNHLMLSYTDPRLTVLYNVYDSTGRVLNQYEHNPRIDIAAPDEKRLVYNFAYDDDGNPDISPDAAHCTLVKNYRDQVNYYTEESCYNSNELKIYNRRGSIIEKWEYNSDGMPVAYYDGLGYKVAYVYDARRRLTKETLPDAMDLGNTWRVINEYQYENNFNKITQKKESIYSTANLTSPVISRTTDYVINSANGNITQIDYPNGGMESFQYDNYGNITKFTDRIYNEFDYTYDIGANYRIKESRSFQGLDGGIITWENNFTYDVFGHKTSYTDGNGGVYLYYYENRGNLRREVNPAGDDKHYIYDLEDHKITEEDEVGKIINYEYDKDINASLLSITKVAANSLVYSRQYDYVGNLMKEINPLGRELTYEYNESNLLSAKFDSVKKSKFSYYNNGWLKIETAEAINNPGVEMSKSEYVYNSHGLKTRATIWHRYNENTALDYYYDGFGRLTKEKDALGRITAYKYDIMGNMIEKVDALGNKYTYTYDAVGNKKSETSPRVNNDPTLGNSEGRTMSYGYDGINRLIRTTNADNKVTWNFYDGNSNLTKVIDRKNFDGTNADRVTEYVYDNLNRKVQEKFADGGIVNYTYDKVGNLKTKKDQLGRIWSYDYDSFNRLVRETDPAGKMTDYTYDEANNKSSITYSDGTKTTYEYDSLNRLTKIKDAANGQRSYGYDALGRKISETDKRGNTTTFEYDWLGRLTKETDPKGVDSSYAYDLVGNRSLQEIAWEKSTSFQYDVLNRVKKIIYPGGKTEEFTYDANGNKASQTNGKGEVTTWVYDKLDRATSKILPGGFTMSYSYDNWNSLVALTDQSGTTNYTYDVMNRLTNESKTITGLTTSTPQIIIRSYNLDNTLKDITDAANRKIDYTYDNRGLLDTVKYGALTLADYTYNALKNPSTISYGNGVNNTYDYDILNRASKIETKNTSSTVLFSQSYLYDAESNRTQLLEGKLVDGVWNTVTTTYTYDSLNQLASVDNQRVNEVGDDVVFAYDNSGNRTNLTTPFGTAAYTYTAGTNELANVTYNNRLAINQTYDANGNLAQEIYSVLGKENKTVSYIWDSENHLSRITYHITNRPTFLPTVPDNTLAFVYDDYGNRTVKDSNGDKTYYINDGLSVLNELDKDGNVTKTMVNGVAEIDKDGIITYIHQDVLGSTVLVTDQTSNVLLQYEYDAFGQMVGMNGKANQTNYLYTGQEYDPESELYYYNARYYNPRLGRFISRDPVLGHDGDALSRNGYIYVKNNPLKYTDPTGEEEKEIAQNLLLQQELWMNPTTMSNSTNMFGHCSSKICEIFGDTVFDVLEGMAKGVDYVSSLSYQGSEYTKNEARESLSRGDIAGALGSYLISGTLENAGVAFDKNSSISTAMSSVVLLGLDVMTFGEGGVAVRGGKTATRLVTELKTSERAIKSLNDLRGFTGHGIDQIISRNIKPSYIKDVIENPLKVIERIDGLGRTSYRYIGEKAVLNFNKARELITGWLK